MLDENARRLASGEIVTFDSRHVRKDGSSQRARLIRGMTNPSHRPAMQQLPATGACLDPRGQRRSRAMWHRHRAIALACTAYGAVHDQAPDTATDAPERRS
jgi:hypothetical protein